MKRLKILDEKGVKLLQEPLNRKIVESLIRSELSIKALSEKFNTPLATIWRRVKELEKAGVVEVVKKERIKNIEIKYYRAAATLYIPKNPVINFAPRSKELKEIHEKYAILMNKIIQEELKYNEVPEQVDPIDYTLALELYATCKILTSEETVSTLKEILKKTERILTELQETKEQAKI